MEVFIRFNTRDEFKEMICESISFAKRVDKEILSNPEYLTAMSGNDEFRQHVHQTKYQLIERINMEKYVVNFKLNQDGIKMLMEYLNLDNDIYARTLFLNSVLNTILETNTSLFKPIILKIIREGIDSKNEKFKPIILKTIHEGIDYKNEKLGHDYLFDLICLVCDFDVMEAYIDKHLEMEDDIHARTFFMNTILNHDTSLFKPIILRLIYEGITFDFRTTQSDDDYFLNRICTKCDLDIINAYIDRYPESLQLCAIDNNPLYAACKRENLEIVRYLLTLDRVREKFSAFYFSENTREIKNSNAILKIFMYEFPNMTFMTLMNSAPRHALNRLIPFLYKFFKNPNEPAFTEFDEFFKRCNYDLRNVEINFFKEILRLYNPHLLQFILDNTDIDLNGGKKKTDLLANLDYCTPSRYDTNYFKCMKILLRSGRYNVTLNDIKACRVFDKELFDLLNSLCTNNEMRSRLKCNYDEYIKCHCGSEEENFDNDDCSDNCSDD